MDEKTIQMKDESIYVIYAILVYFVTVYVYGVVTYFTAKNACSKLRNTGAPGQSCVSPNYRTTRCWNSGTQLSCTHCVFGSKSSKIGHVCASNDDVVDSIAVCKYENLNNIPLVTSNDSRVIIRYRTETGSYEEATPEFKPSILKMLKTNCYYDLEIKSPSSDPAVKTECQDVSTKGDGICNKDYDTYVKTQKIRYRPDTDPNTLQTNPPSLKFTNETTTTTT